MPRIVALLSASLLIAGCTEELGFFGTEDIGDADVRIVFAESPTFHDVRVLPKETPYRIAGTTLDDALSGGELRLTVFGYQSEDLRAAIPSLMDLDARLIAQTLTAEVGPPQPGRFRAFATDIVRQAVIREGETGQLDYAALGWSDVATEEVTRFSLGYSCEIIEVPFRAFEIETPGVAASYTRGADCLWTPVAANAALDAKLGGMSPLYEDVDGSLLLGSPDERCAEVIDDPLPLGVTRAWDCGDVRLAVQYGGPDFMTTAPITTWQSQDFAGSAPAVAAPNGLLYYSQDDAFLKRLELVGTIPKPVNVQGVLLQSSGQSLVASANGLSATLTTPASFAENVGLSRPQCIMSPSDAFRSATISRRVSDTELELEAPGLPANLISTSWLIFGDPNLFSDALTRSFDLAAVGTIERVTVDPDDAGGITLHGSTKSFYLERYTRIIEFAHLFMCPFEIVPTDAVGDVIQGGDNIYALQASGIQVFSFQGEALRSVSAGSGYGGEHRIEAVSRNGGGDAVVVWSDTTLEVIDPVSESAVTHTVPGPIVTIIDGPSVIYRPSGALRTLEMVDASGPALGQPQRFIIPAFRAEVTEPLQIAPDARLIAGSWYLAFSTGTHAGVFSLRSGLSQAVQSQNAVGGLFENASTGVVVLQVPGDDDRSRQRLIRFTDETE